MIRAGVDDRAMLAAAGVNVQRGVRHRPSPSAPAWPGLAASSVARRCRSSPGEDTRLLLASLVVVIVGGMGSVVGAAVGARLLGLAEHVRAGLRADLQRGLHLRDHGARAGLPAARNHGPAGVSAADVAPGDEPPGDRGPARPVAPRPAAAHDGGAQRRFAESGRGRGTSIVRWRCPARLSVVSPRRSSRTRSAARRWRSA